jgi:ethanolamine ammonia-lyase small subunit
VSPPLTPDPWGDLRAYTRARIALGRAGGSLPTAELLGFSAAHAAARDAVWSALDVERLEADLAMLALPLVRARSQAPDRPTYLQRPDLGRRLEPGCSAPLAAARAALPGGACDLALVVADGLSASAAQRHAPALLRVLIPRLRQRGIVLGPLVIATQARVALEDAVGEALGARSALILLGERPGLGAPDSLGGYLVYEPRPGNSDARRNCVSSIRPDGLPVEAAADLIDWLVAEALRRGLTGVELKDERGMIEAGAGIAPAMR